MSQIQVDNIYNKEATGSPSFPLGANVTGVITATTFKGGAEITSGTISATSVTAASGTFNGPVTIGGTLTYEDVTNIDSVGVITARNGINVSGGIGTFAGNINVSGNINANGNIVGDNSTNISGVSSVTATNFYGNGASLSGIEAAPTITGISSGTMSAEDVVLVKEDGTLTKVVGVSSQFGPAMANIYEANEISTMSAYDPDNGFVLFTTRSNSSYSSRLYVSSINSSTGVMTQLEAQNIGTVDMDPNIAYDTTNNIFVYTYRDGYGDLQARAGSVDSNGAVTLSSSTQEISADISGALNQSRLIYDPTSNKFLIVFTVNSNDAVRAATGVVGGTAPNYTTTWTSGYIYGAQASEPAQPCLDTLNNKIFSAYRNHATIPGSGYAQCGTITADGTYSRGSNALLTSSNNDVYNIACVHDPAVDKVFYVWNKNDGTLEYRVGSASGSSTTISWDTAPVELDNSGGEYGRCCYDVEREKIVVMWSDSSSNKGWIKSGKIGSDGVVTWDPLLEFNANRSFGGSPVYASNEKRVVLTYINGGQNNLTNQRAWRLAGNNLKTTNYIGFSKEAYTDGQTATVKIVGNVTNQSGLTPGKKYYIQGDGTLGSTPASPSVEAGTSISSTQLIIKG